MAIEMFTGQPAAPSFRQAHFGAVDDSLNAHYRNQNNGAAELERSLIPEIHRTRLNVERVRELKQQGINIRAKALLLNVSKSTVSRVLIDQRPDQRLSSDSL